MSGIDGLGRGSPQLPDVDLVEKQTRAINNALTDMMKEVIGKLPETVAKGDVVKFFAAQKKEISDVKDKILKGQVTGKIMEIATKVIHLEKFGITPQQVGEKLEAQFEKEKKEWNEITGKSSPREEKRVESPTPSAPKSPTPSAPKGINADAFKKIFSQITTEDFNKITEYRGKHALDGLSIGRQDELIGLMGEVIPAASPDERKAQLVLIMDHIHDRETEGKDKFGL